MRVTFAAPFVIVTACGGPQPTTQEEYERSTQRWTIERDGDECFVEEHGGCDDCNPPSPTPVRCVYGPAWETTVFRLHDKCWIHAEPRRDVPCPDEMVIDEP